MERPTSCSRGFSLIELLIVVAVIGIIAAIALPNLQSSRRAANEAAAIAHLRTWTSAQEIYFQRHRTYAPSEGDLVGEHLVGDMEAIESGYVFTVTAEGGGSINWSGTAIPETPGTTGDRHFFIDQTGVIRWSLDGEANANSPALGSGGN